MGIIAVSKGWKKQWEKERVRDRVSLTARRGLLDLEVLEAIAASYDRQTQKDARKYAARLVALWKAGHLTADLAAREQWRRVEMAGASLWLDEDGQVITRQMAENEREQKEAAQKKIAHDREQSGTLCGASLANGKTCKNQKVKGAARCYRHGGENEKPKP